MLFAIFIEKLKRNQRRPPLHADFFQLELFQLLGRSCHVRERIIPCDLTRDLGWSKRLALGNFGRSLLLGLLKAGYLSKSCIELSLDNGCFLLLRLNLQLALLLLVI